MKSGRPATRRLIRFRLHCGAAVLLCVSMFLEAIAAQDGLVRAAPAAQPPGNPASRAIIVGLPELRSAPDGGLAIEPNVVVSAEAPPPAEGGWNGAGAVPSMIERPLLERWAQQFNLMPSDAELIGPPAGMPLPAQTEYYGPPLEAFPLQGECGPVAQPIFGRIVSRLHHDDCNCCDEEGWFSRLLPTFGSPEGGIGRDRVALAPHVIDISQPQNQFRLGVDLVSDFRLPDRAEYLWSKPGRGPAPERAVSYQDLRFLMETGGPKFSVGTEIPIRILDPEINLNTAGLSDLNLTTKLVLFDGDEYQLTQIFRAYFNTGAPRKGLGSGHISLEPGLLARYRASDTLYWHGALQYWIPVGSDPVHSGQVLSYGVGWSHLLYDSDTFAVVDTFEVMGWSVLDGQKLDPITFQPIEIDGEAVAHLYPGLRIVHDTGGDCGLVEWGISGTVGMGNSRWYDSLVRMNVRVIY